MVAGGKVFVEHATTVIAEQLGCTTTAALRRLHLVASLVDQTLEQTAFHVINGILRFPLERSDRVAETEPPDAFADAGGEPIVSFALRMIAAQARCDEGEAVHRLAAAVSESDRTQTQIALDVISGEIQFDP